MKKTFVVATTGDRADGLKRLIISLNPFFKSGWEIVSVCQSYEIKDFLDIKSLIGQRGKAIRFDNLIGAHSAKVFALKTFKSDIWCSLDDDMFATPKSDYNRISNILSERKDIGFISGNWARTYNLAMAKNQQDKLIPQKLVFTGGGMVFRDDVADIVRHIPDEQYLFDDCLWAMYAYINGYDNFRYLGSVSVHQICSKGGRRTWLKSKPERVLPPEEYLRVRKGSQKDGYNEYLICNDSDLTELAHLEHRKRKADV